MDSFQKRRWKVHMHNTMLPFYEMTKPHRTPLTTQEGCQSLLANAQFIFLL